MLDGSTGRHRAGGRHGGGLSTGRPGCRTRGAVSPRPPRARPTGPRGWRDGAVREDWRWPGRPHGRARRRPGGRRPAPAGGPGPPRPEMIRRCAPALLSTYVSVIEVGDAYAVRFRALLDFLGVRTLVVTDLDSNEAATRNGLNVH
ncbi:ATP-dependent endonuclease [Streptomyces sp. CB01881]|nr:ATP-dependent endonuclease [Streptomyces sp. CB01881]